MELTANRIGDATAEKMGEALKVNSTLTKLNLKRIDCPYSVLVLLANKQDNCDKQRILLVQMEQIISVKH